MTRSRLGALTLLALCLALLISLGVWMGLQPPSGTADAPPQQADRESPAEPSPAPPVPPDSTDPVTPAEPAVTPPGRPLNVLVMGVDEDKLRTDVIFVVHLDPAQGLSSVISLPRDTRVEIPCPPDLKACKSPDKLGHAHAYGYASGRGPALAKATVEQFLGITIDHYVWLDFEGFTSVVDTLGGITVQVDQPMDDIGLAPGEHRLDGAKALQYVRFRSDGMGDIGRIRRTQEFLFAVARAARERTTLIQAPLLLRQVMPLVSTDLDPLTALALAQHWRDLDRDSIQTVSLPGESVMIDGLWFWQVDPAEVQELVREYITELAPPEKEGS